MKEMTAVVWRSSLSGQVTKPGALITIMVNHCLFISSRYHYFIISSYVLSLTGCAVGVCGVDVLEIVAYSWCRKPRILSWCVCMVKKRQTNKLETLMRVACVKELKHEHLLEVVQTNFAVCRR